MVPAIVESVPCKCLHDTAAGRPRSRLKWLCYFETSNLLQFSMMDFGFNFFSVACIHQVWMVFARIGNGLCFCYQNLNLHSVFGEKYVLSSWNWSSSCFEMPCLVCSIMERPPLNDNYVLGMSVCTTGLMYYIVCSSHRFEGKGKMMFCVLLSRKTHWKTSGPARCCWIWVLSSSCAHYRVFHIVADPI